MIRSTSTQTIPEAAEAYTLRGWAVVALAPKTKRPIHEDFLTARFSVDEVGDQFRAGENVGIALGDNSSGIVDVDLDCEQALTLADQFLPSTSAVFGRPSSPRSHRLYYCGPSPQTKQFRSREEGMIVELRSTGGQTMFPPSVHPNGEQLEWIEDGEPASIPGDELTNRVLRLAVASMYLAHYPAEGSRQNAALALACGLLLSWPVEQVEHLIRAVAEAADDEEVDDRVGAVAATKRKLDAKQKVQGWPTLAKLIGEKTVATMKGWMKRDEQSLQESSGEQSVLDLFPHAPVCQKVLVPQKWRLSKDGVLGIEHGIGRKIMASRTPVIIVGRCVDADEGTELLKVAYQRDGGWKTLIRGRDVFASSRAIVELAKVGFPVTTTTARSLVEYLADFESLNLEHLPVSTVTSQMGWREDRFMLGTQCLSTGDGKTRATEFEGRDTGDQQLAGGYHREGSLDGWIAAVAGVAHFPRLTLVVYASCATPLLKLVGAPNFLIDLWGRTSIGKTILLRNAASVWGNPDERTSDTIIQTFAATRVNLERLASVNTDLPLFIDESQRGDPRTMPTLIYDLAQGRGKGRGSLQGTQQVKTFRSVIFTTGEQPLTSFRMAGGAHARVLELGGMPFNGTHHDTGQLVSEVNRAVCANYGHVGLRFIEFLLTHRGEWGSYRRRYRELSKDYAERAADASVLSRMADYFAVIDLAGELLHQCLDLPWAFKSPVGELWSDLASGAGQADKAREAMEFIHSWTESHADSFLGAVGDLSNQRAPGGGWAGQWCRQDPEWDHVAFYPHKLKELMTAQTYHAEAILRVWRERNWIAVDRDGTQQSKRFTKRLTIADAKSPMIVIRRSAFDVDVDLV